MKLETGDLTAKTPRAPRFAKVFYCLNHEEHKEHEEHEGYYADMLVSFTHEMVKTYRFPELIGRKLGQFSVQKNQL